MNQNAAVTRKTARSWGAWVAGGLLALLLGAMLLTSRTATPAGQQRLPYQPGWAGLTVNVPIRPGLWLETVPSRPALWLHARAEAEPQSVDLCSVRKGMVHDPDLIYPIRVVGPDQAESSPVAASHALVVPADAAVDAPKVQILGRAGKNGADLQLQWQGRAAWLAVNEGKAVHNTGDNAATGHRLLLPDQGWLLWHKQAGGGYEWGLQWMRLPSTGCAAGRVQLQLWRAQAVPQVEGWVFDAALRLQRLHLPPGTHTFAAAPVEDEQLFHALGKAGLLRLREDGLLDAAPAEFSQALTAASHRMSPYWVAQRRKLQSAGQAAQADALLKRLYHKRDGDYLRRQIARFNLAQRCRLAPSTESACAPVNQWQPLQVQAGQLAWRSAPATTPAATPTTGPLRLLTRTGEPYPNLPTWLGDLPRALAGAPRTVRLTLDPAWQGQAQAVVACQPGKWQAGRCTELRDAAAGERSAIVVLDADSGDIVVAATHGMAAPWQHDGGLGHNPGSAFKVVTALGLELAAKQQPWLEPVLAGVPGAWQHGEPAGYRHSAPCYPTPCSGRAGEIRNFRDHRPSDYAEGGRFGLTQALSASLNTWFAWAAEESDTTVAQARIGQRPLRADALDSARPVWAAAHVLGFEQALRLDGGIAPQQAGAFGEDILTATPSRFDRVQDRAQIRWHTIGSRMQATPLQMARVAAAVASGHVPTPRLLLPASDAAVPAGPPLPMSTARVRAGMKAVVTHGTAASTFATLPALRAGMYGKTGTVPRGRGQAENTAWFIGWMEPGTLPGENRRLAFAVMVNRTDETGGTGAARVWVDSIKK